MGSNLSAQGDIYSYGILLLEIFTGKNPTDDVFNNDLNLRTFVKISIPDQVMTISDPLLLEDKDTILTGSTKVEKVTKHDKIIGCLQSIFTIGIACSEDLPGDRMELKNVIKELQHIKSTLLT